MDNDIVVTGTKSNKTYSCSRCNYQTTRAYNVQRHLAKHFEKPPRELQHLCSYSGCSFATLRWDNLSRHIRKVHGATVPTSRNPPKIEENQQTEEDLEDISYKEELDLPIDENPETPYDDIDTISTSTVDFPTYDQSASPQSSEPIEIELANSPEQKEEPKVKTQNTSGPKRKIKKGKYKLYECLKCSYQTNRGYNIRRHVIKHGEPQMLHVCIISGCGFSTPRWDNLCRHVKRVHPESDIENQHQSGHLDITQN